MSSDIKVRTLTGAGIKTYIPSILKVQTEVLREFPYLSLNNAEAEMKYLKQLSQSKDSIAVLVFDGPKIVGVSTGIPLEEHRPGFQKIFLDRIHNPSDYYYFGTSALMQEYRGRGIAHHFFDLRENHVKQLKKYKKICFTTVIRPKDHHKRPADYSSLDNFWKKRGYVEHKDLIVTLPWREIGEEEPSHKPMNFWIKSLS
ncbi:MAG TPA: hypothetical protein PKW79_04130 [Rhabdochlamydiaceae bacterium]|nr:hypothetical protein [Rhabdochlamydiaceae bacterium]